MNCAGCLFVFQPYYGLCQCSETIYWIYSKNILVKIFWGYTGQAYNRIRNLGRMETSVLLSNHCHRCSGLSGCEDPQQAMGLSSLRASLAGLGVTVIQILPGWAVGAESIHDLFWCIFHATVLRATQCEYQDWCHSGMSGWRERAMRREKIWCIGKSTGSWSLLCHQLSVWLWGHFSSGSQFLSEYEMSIGLNQGWRLPSTHTATLCFCPTTDTVAHSP